jgi:hypothetical protein
MKLKCTRTRYTCDGTVTISVKEGSRRVVLTRTTYAALNGHTTVIRVALSRVKLARIRRDHRAQITLTTNPDVGTRPSRRAQHIVVGP